MWIVNNNNEKHVRVSRWKRGDGGGGGVAHSLMTSYFMQILKIMGKPNKIKTKKKLFTMHFAAELCVCAHLCALKQNKSFIHFMFTTKCEIIDEWTLIMANFFYDLFVVNSVLVPFFFFVFLHTKSIFFPSLKKTNNLDCIVRYLLRVHSIWFNHAIKWTTNEFVLMKCDV